MAFKVSVIFDSLTVPLSLTTYILLHAILKRSDRTPEGDIELAIKRMNDYKSRY